MWRTLFLMHSLVSERREGFSYFKPQSVRGIPMNRRIKVVVGLAGLQLRSGFLNNNEGEGGSTFVCPF